MDEANYFYLLPPVTTKRHQSRNDNIIRQYNEDMAKVLARRGELSANDKYEFLRVRLERRERDMLRKRKSSLPGEDAAQTPLDEGSHRPVVDGDSDSSANVTQQRRRTPGSQRDGCAWLVVTPGARSARTRSAGLPYFELAELPALPVVLREPVNVGHGQPSWIPYCSPLCPVESVRDIRLPVYSAASCPVLAGMYSQDKGRSSDPLRRPLRPLGKRSQWQFSSPMGEQPPPSDGSADVFHAQEAADNVVDGSAALPENLYWALGEVLGARIMMFEGYLEIHEETPYPDVIAALWFMFRHRSVWEVAGMVLLVA